MGKEPGGEGRNRWANAPETIDLTPRSGILAQREGLSPYAPVFYRAPVPLRWGRAVKSCKPWSDSLSSGWLHDDSLEIVPEPCGPDTRLV